MHKSESVFVNFYQSHVSKLPNGKLDKPSQQRRYMKIWINWVLYEGLPRKELTASPQPSSVFAFHAMDHFLDFMYRTRENVCAALPVDLIYGSRSAASSIVLFMWDSTIH